MWRDVSNDVTVKSGKIIHDSQVVGQLSYGCISACAPRYRVRLERGVDADGYFNRFFIERDFDATELQSLAFNTKSNPAPKPIVAVRRVRFIALEQEGGELYVNANAIVIVKRVMANKCELHLENGNKLLVDYDAKRIRQKLEELEPNAVQNG